MCHSSIFTLIHGNRPDYQLHECIYIYMRMHACIILQIEQRKHFTEQLYRKKKIDL